MGIFLLRRSRSPLIVAVILLTVLHGAIGRHRIRHYKDRFKRQQGAHLYLPGSSVTGGGDGPDSGPWSEWSEPSPCSRTCGGGVSTQYRQCQEGYSCQGPAKRHFSCNTQDCPDTGDFRAQQCSEYDEIPFENVKYQWVPYTKGPNPCELNCMPKGQRFYYRHAPKVKDGTRCTDEGLDVCVDGECQPVGCDMMLGSNLKEDDCRVCGGDGSTCNTLTNILPLNDMQVGYNDILLIPTGATNVVIEELEPSNNYLAIRNTSGHYYLNGNWRIDFPRSIDFAGSKFHYERYPQGFAAPDKVFTLGPIDESLFIVLLYQDSTVPVQYKYSIPTNVQPGSESETYAWTFDEFTPCSATCGGGVQYRNVSCAGRKTLEPVDEGLCDGYKKPETSRKCNEIACDAQWVPHPWGNCSAPCGEEGGYQTRQISCQQIISNGYPTLVDDSECRGPKPPEKQKCNQGKTCAKWYTEPWIPCDHLCGDGKQTRKVQCYIKDENGKIQILEEGQCEAVEPKPAIEQNCFLRPCEGLDWISSEWSGCDTVCGLTNETRKIFCATSNGQIYGDELCDQRGKPETVRKCDGNNNASCNYLWYASQWSECSVKCGSGIQTRTIFCGLSTKEGVQKVDNEKCDQSKNFETIKNCTGTEECDGEWFSGPWGECSKECGGGERTKKVVCIKDNLVVDVSHCNEENIIFSQEDCNTEPCTEDSIIPVDSDKPLESALKDKESTEKTTESDIIESAESTRSTTLFQKESDGTQSDTSVDISELTKSVEFSTEPTEAAESEDDYELVLADSCDDGEWVQVEKVASVVDKEETTPTDLSQTTETTSEKLETLFSIYDTMYSDGTTIEETPFTGSGDGSSLFTETSPGIETTSLGSSLTTEEEEGSGSGSSIVTDEESVTVTYSGSTQDISGSTEATSQSSEFGSSSSESITDSDLSSTKISTISSEESSSTDLTTDPTDISTSATTEGASESSTTDASTDESSQATTVGLTETSDGASTEESSTTDIFTDESSITTTSESTEFSTEIRESNSEFSTEQSTETSLLPTETTIYSSESTEFSSESTEGSTETSGVSTESTEYSTGSTTEESSASTEIHIQEEPDDNNFPEPPRRVESKVSTSSVTESTDVTTEISGSTETGAEFTSSTGESESTSTTEGFSTTEGLSTTETGSTEFGSTEVSGTIEVGSTTEASDSTGSTATTEVSGSTGPTATTEVSGSTGPTATTEVSGASTEASYSTGLTESTEQSRFTETTQVFTTESTTEYSGSTETDIFSSTSETTEGTTWGTTHITEIFKKKQKMCKRKKIMLCQKSQYGCCWDNIHSAKGPFDEGCPSPQTCKESTFGCCPDGASAALGPKNRGCPSSNCNETLFGCCWDKKTTTEGNNEEGCPLRPPACLESKWGCCKDNATEAKGPNSEGCEPEKEEKKIVKATPTKECSKTEFGCCPDLSPAEGPQYQGCKLPCSNTTYGCCPDKEAPAHGPNGEGCCLGGPFGCCPDDITPARGPNGDGCECQYSPYGCCPDNATVAKGYNKEGCGCTHSQYGCCPDDGTPARGPDFEGCPCHSFQFGCCPDGISVADGPQQQGCDCRTTEFGCCSDDKTTAQGPNLQGCGCETSKFGCCLDGVSEAKGDNFEGCEEVPIDQQSSCSEPKERGPCRNYTVKWFYDMSYGGCSRFWYGGCEGNDNRFKSKEECEGICVKPQGIDRCKLPKVQGSCEGYFPQWYYDKESKHCTQFAYGGCLGNNNKFETREECSELCVKDDTVDPCEQKMNEGPCRGQFRRYYYDKDSSQCQAFAYGGCKGNGNNFVSLEACRQKCTPPGKQRDYCTIPKAEGNCTTKEALWYFGDKERRCLPFYYSGCNGNKNNFESKELCEEQCPLEVARKTCHLPADIGECGNYVSRWYHDTKLKRCRQFYWGGCGGNGNNFQTEEECQQSCEGPQEPPTIVDRIDIEPEPEVTEAPRTQAPWIQPHVPPTTYRSITIEEICSLVPDSGPCTEYTLKFYYDRVEGVCKNFTYGGCAGNYNNFQSEEQCLQYCGTVGAQPQLQSSPQPLPQPQPTPEATATEPPQPQVLPVEDNQCYENVDPGNCTGSYQEFYYERNTGKCEPFNYTGCGGNRNRFYSDEECHRQCGDYRGQDVCNLDNDTGPCRGYFVKYYFNRNTNRCDQFIYGGCNGNGNRFGTEEECKRYCEPAEEPQPNLTSTAEKEPEGFSTQECQAKFEECNSMLCSYGVEAYVDEHNCRVCRCVDPCKDVVCPDGSKCGIDLNTNRTSLEDAEFIAICRETNKTGACPYTTTFDANCGRECQTDADCSSYFKCCPTNCGTSCLEPERPLELVTQSIAPAYTTPGIENIFYAPKVDVKIFQPEVSALLGDQAVLNCAVSGNPNPNISWSKDNVEIDGTLPRYRIRLDQTLQIITLHKTDSGVYLCTANNGLGKPVRNQIKLEVQVPVKANITTNDQKYPTGSTIEINCDVYGYPPPQVQWFKDGVPIQNNGRINESDDHKLTINSADKSDSGRYQCEATNTYSKAASSIDISVEGMYIHPSCTDNRFFANCQLIVKGRYCNHKYYAKFCCRSCTEAGQLPIRSGQYYAEKQEALDNNTV